MLFIEFVFFMCSDSYPIEKVALAGTSGRKKQNHEKL
jgi:hypothetical protein